MLILSSAEANSSASSPWTAGEVEGEAMYLIHSEILPS